MATHLPRPDALAATGRSDWPNRVNNVLGFPYIFRGALDVGAREINEEMKIAATRALARLAREPVLLGDAERIEALVSEHGIGGLEDRALIDPVVERELRQDYARISTRSETVKGLPSRTRSPSLPIRTTSEARCSPAATPTARSRGAPGSTRRPYAHQPNTGSFLEFTESLAGGEQSASPQPCDILFLMTMHRGKRTLPRVLGLVFGLAGAGIMIVDSLEHIRRGFVGLSAIFIIVGALLSAGLGGLVGIAIERVRERRRKTGRYGRRR